MISRNLQSFEGELRLRRAANAELSHRADDLEARHVGANEKRSHALNALAPSLHKRLRKRRDHTGAMSVADPDLAAVQSPM